MNGHKERLVNFFLPTQNNSGRAIFLHGPYLVLLLLILAVLKLSFWAFLYYFPNSSLFADITKSSIINLVNDTRAEYSLPGLKESAVLDAAANLKAQDMMKNGYFQHTSPSGVDPWHWFKEAGYLYRYAGENLAIGFVDSSEVNNAWLASPTHRANIMNSKYRDIGVAVVNGNFQGQPSTIVVQLFGNGQAGSAAAQLAELQGKINDLKGRLAQKNAEASQEQVMGAATQNPQGSAGGNFVASFFAEKYYNIVQLLVYACLTIVIVLLILNFAIKPDFEHSDLIAKAVGFLAIAAIFALIDRNLTIALIPHSLQIF